MTQPKQDEAVNTGNLQSALDEALRSVERRETERKSSVPAEVELPPAVPAEVPLMVEEERAPEPVAAAVPPVIKRTPQDAIIEALIKGKQEATDALKQTQREAKDLLDARTRTQADFENFKRRVQKDKQDTQLFATQNLVRDLLPVLDNFERAMAASPDAASADAATLLTGIKMVHRQLVDVVRRAGAEPFASKGTAFDPSKHEAVAQVAAPPGMSPGQVVEEHQRGYMFHDRLLRPAMVVVAGAPDPTPSAP